ncbi:MAG: hypothetical protein JO022_13615, partial [Acidobacteriaceae bacterium]|nr:hypothetical protein [Acidobacteriaceae bacterium]
DFPAIGESYYPLTLGPNSFYWFSLEKHAVRVKVRAPEDELEEAPLQLVTIHNNDVWDPANLPAIAGVLSGFLPTRRWFRSKDRRFRSVDITEVVSLQSGQFALLLVRADYTSGDPETYLMPVAIALSEQADSIKRAEAESVIAEIHRLDGTTALLYDGAVSHEFTTSLLEAFARRRRFNGEEGSMQALRNREFRHLWGPTHPNFEPTVLASSEVDTAIKFGDRFVLTLLRRVEPGIHPSVELGQYLTEVVHFAHCAPFAGSLEYHAGQSNSEPMTLAVLHGYVPNEGDGWRLTRRELSDYLQRMGQAKCSIADLQKSAPTAIYDLDFALSDPPEVAGQLIGPYLGLVTAMGQRVAELHLALSQNASDPAFAPEPFNDFYRQGLYHANIALTSRRMEFVRQRSGDMIPEIRQLAAKVLEQENAITSRFRAVFDQRIASQRIRFHGRLHLGHMLIANGDVVMFDFAGEPQLHISERRIKRCPLRDVASMLYSFGYSAQAAARELLSAERHESADRDTIRSWARFWYSHVSAAFIRAYWKTASPASYMPESQHDQQVLLDNYLLERALLDVRADINDKPELAGMPFRVILHLLDAEAEQRMR